MLEKKRKQTIKSRKVKSRDKIVHHDALLHACSVATMCILCRHDQLSPKVLSYRKVFHSTQKKKFESIKELNVNKPFNKPYY